MRKRGYYRLQMYWRENISFRLSVLFLLFYLCCAVLAPFLPLPYGPNDQDLNSLYQPPFNWSLSADGQSRHLLGTDVLGRDVLANLVYGCRTSLLISITVMGLATFLGVCLGSLAGFFGDRSYRVSYASVILFLLALPMAWFYGFYRRQYVLLDAAATSPFDFFQHLAISFGIILLVMGVALGITRAIQSTMIGSPRFYLPLDLMVVKLMEIITAIPRLILILSLAAFMYPSLPLLMLLIAFSYWAGPARLVRAELKKVAALPYIQAAGSLGIPPHRIFFRHALPNALGSVAVAFTFGVASLLALESTLSFLGIGIPVDLATWGRMMAGVKQNLSAWWLVVFPGALLSLTVLSLQTCSLYFQKAYLFSNN